MLKVVLCLMWSIYIGFTAEGLRESFAKAVVGAVAIILACEVYG